MKQTEVKELVLLIIIFLTFRFLFLTRLPIFNDEAIYLDWGWREIHLPGNLFLSLFDSKQPLLMWVFGLSQNIFSDPLIGGRLVSVLTGLLTVFGIYKLALWLFNKKIARISFLLYLLIPLFSFYDRQALMESALAASGIWSLYFLLKLFKKPDFKNSLGLGIALGLGFFVKSSALLFIFNTVILGLFLLFKTAKKEQRTYLSHLLLGLVITGVILIPLILQPDFWQALSRDDRFSLRFDELLSLPLDIWFRNFRNSLLIIFFKLSPGVFLLSLGALIYFLKSKKLMIKIMAWWFLLGLGFYLLFIRHASMRYITPYLPLTALFAAGIIDFLIKKYKKFGVAISALVLIIAFGLTSWQMLQPAKYLKFLSQHMPDNQYMDYVTGWPAGFGVKETVEFLKKQATGKSMIVGIRPDHGNPESAMMAYFNDDPKIAVSYFDKNYVPMDLNQVDCLTSNLPFYFVARDEHTGGLGQYYQQIAKFGKPEDKSAISVYTWKQTCQGQTLVLNFKAK